MRKLLVVRFSSIGDIVLTTPVIRCLKRQIPDVELHYLTKAAYGPILEANPHVDRLFLLQDNWTDLITLLRAERYEAVIDLHHNLRTFKLQAFLRRPFYRFPKLNWKKWLVVQMKWKSLLPDVSVVDRYFEAVKSLGIKPDGEGVDYFIPEKARFPIENLPVVFQRGYLAWAIGAAHATKKLPADRMLQLAALIPYPIVVIGGKEDAAMGNRLVEQHQEKIYNVAGRCTLHQSADLIRQSHLLLTHDTGMMHIGAAFRKPMVTLWGNTIPEFGMYPYYGSKYQQGKVSDLFDIIEHTRLSCRPCSKIGYEACPRVHFKCMRELDLLAIAQAIHRRWESISG
ncbi:MAG: glycosyltransferase family 9 protein [Thermoflavifilum sp.]|nr:glycosyltransferase family 9 protein [Thermoflavifilum sp.]